MPARHYNLEYNVNSGPWLSGILDETPGAGKQLAIGGLAVGTYAVKLRMVPLSGDVTPIVSNELIMQVGTPAITEPVFSTAESVTSVAEVITRRDALLAAAGVDVTVLDTQTMNEALLSTASESGSVVTGYVDTVTAAANSDATVATVQVMLEQVSAAITAADSSTSAATMVDNSASSADVIPSQTDTYQQAANVAPSFTAQPVQTGGTTTTVTVSYTTSDVNGDHYKLEYSIGAGFVVAVADEAPGAHSVTITGLTAGQTNSVQLRATALTGDVTPVLSNWVTTVAVTNAPSLSAAAGNTQNTLTMSATGATSYNLYYTIDGSTPTLASTKIAGVSSPYTHPGLVNDTTYKYIATAVNAAGESSASVVASAIPSAYPTALNSGDSVASAMITPLTVVKGTYGAVTQTAAAAFKTSQNTNTTTLGNAYLYSSLISGVFAEREFEFSGWSGPNGSYFCGIMISDDTQVFDTSPTYTGFSAKAKFYVYISGVSGSPRMDVVKRDTGGAATILQSNNTWAGGATNFTSLRFSIERTATDYIVKVKNGSGTVVASATVAISSVFNGASDCRIALGVIPGNYNLARVEYTITERS